MGFFEHLPVEGMLSDIELEDLVVLGCLITESNRTTVKF